ncbi:efflux RND transporter periplasmic adaptor subunit [Thalassotalea sp. ND16A]|uniref:efflux RND transporter periplasmic adaptor subunit n=1 Tax=Thalassotalea sp. ND16A TaxID=1535422 RepID=UPI00051A40B1|nr:efflux RND transporter periplasmic adaptor subunit [Thalassotalea sp. ND16A]KGJ89202.1 hypothetical protein ND16A_2095 [Thalassotalea sp. ND16A]
MAYTPQSSTASKPKSKLFLIGMPLLIIIAGILGFSSLSGMAKKPEKKPVVNKAPIVDVITVAQRDVTFNIASQGTVVARTETLLISEVSGQITFVSEKFLVGGYFARGEVLLEIDPITYQVAVLEAESRLGAMQASLIEEQARTEQAKEEWLLTGKTVEQAPVLALRLPQYQKAQAELKAAEADLQQANIKLSRTKIIAPYDALLNEKHVDIGQYVSTGSQLAKTIAIDFAEVRLPIKQQDIGFIHLPKINQHNYQPTPVQISSMQGSELLSWNSSIHRYEGVVDQQSRVHFIVAQVADPYNLKDVNTSDAELRVGTFVNASIVGKTETNLYTVPRTALHGLNQLHLIDNANKLHIITVKVIRSEKDRVYLAADIASDMRVVTTKLATPVKGMVLRVNGELVEQTNEAESLTPEKVEG